MQVGQCRTGGVETRRTWWSVAPWKNGFQKCGFPGDGAVGIAGNQAGGGQVVGCGDLQPGGRGSDRRTERGVGYLLGEGEDPVIPRTYYIDNPAADRIATRAHALRKRAGRLTGHALGEAPPEQAERSSTLLEDILAFCPPEEGNGKFWTEAIAARLAEAHPGTYAELGRDALAATLRTRHPRRAGVGHHRRRQGREPARHRHPRHRPTPHRP